MSDNVREQELNGIVKLIVEDLARLIVQGAFPLNRIWSDHNHLLSTIGWHFELKDVPMPFEQILTWIQENGLKIPWLFIDCVGTEFLAQQFAFDLKRGKKKVENAQLDHDIYALRMAAHFFPYCDAVFTDSKLANDILPRIRRSNRISSPIYSKEGKDRVFSDHGSFLEFLEELSPIIESTSVRTEAADEFFKMVLYLCRESDPLISRELLASSPFPSEILRGGGLKVWSQTSNVEWDQILAEFRKLRDEYMESAGEGRLMALERNGGIVVKWDGTIPFGIFTSEYDDMGQTIRNSAGRLLGSGEPF